MKNVPKKVARERYVVIFDILGFKERVKENTHRVIYNQLFELKSLLNSIESQESFTIGGSKRLGQIQTNTFLFSDTILIISDEVTENDFASMLANASSVLQYCFKNSIPIKGSIAKGEISVNKSQQIFFGRPIIDAYLLSEEMKFMGLIFDRSMEETFNDFNHLRNTAKFEKVHLKSGRLKHYFLNLSNLKLIPKVQVDAMIEGINKMYISANAGPRQYFDNTMELYGWDKTM